MNGKYKQLADFVARIMDEKDLSHQRVAAQSKRRGGGISGTTVWNIRNNTYKDIGLETLKALAYGLGVDPVIIFRLALSDVLKTDNAIAEMEDAALKNTIERLLALPASARKSLEPLIEVLAREVDYRENMLHKESKRKKTINN